MKYSKIFVSVFFIMFCGAVQAQAVSLGSLMSSEITSPFYKYSSKVLKNDPSLATMVNNITADCGTNVYCRVQKVFEYVRTEVPYVGEPNGVENVLAPYETLRRGGDCEDLSILLASMLNTMRLKPYLVAVPGHMYVMACGLSGGQVFNPSYSAVYDQSALVGGGRAQIIEMKKMKHIRIESSSSKPFDITLFPSSLDYRNRKNGRSATYYPDCSVKGVTEFKKECLFPKEGAVLMLSGEESVSVKMKIELVSMPNVRQYSYEGMSCIMLDPSFRGNAADIGAEMPKYRNAKKEAVKAW
jgi:hypothetical protein